MTSLKNTNRQELEKPRRCSMERRTTNQCVEFRQQRDSLFTRDIPPEIKAMRTKDLELGIKARALKVE